LKPATKKEIQEARGKASTSNPQLQRKILEAEEQLAKKTSTINKERNSPDKMTNKVMIAPGARDAPKFSSKRPQELRRFVRQMEDLWKESGVEKDEEKKDSIVKYTDQDSEEEWKALGTYEKGSTWDQFKDELMENYPEAAAAERGTPARIKQLCEEIKGIRLGDLTALYSFRRAFTAEAKKLTKAPAVMSNRELVELFIGSLSETMAAAVLQFLGNRAEAGKQKEAAVSSKTNRRPEDKYDLEEICKAAIQVSESSQGMFHLMNKPLPEPVSERRVMMFNQPASETTNLIQKLEEIENIQAQERDKLVIANKNMDSRFNELQDLMKTLLAQVPGSGGPGPRARQYDPGNGIKLGQPGSIPKWGSSGRTHNDGCFYCGGKDHFVPDCEEMKDDVRAGKVKLNAEGKLRLNDGSYIPNIPGVSTIKERVERAQAKKLNQFYCGNEDDNEPSSLGSKIPAQYLNLAMEDPVRRKARLELELDLKEREEALELKQLKLEREEKKKEHTNKTTRAAHVLDMLEQLTDKEIAALKSSRSDFH
jgi:hypothetical protein